jgi:ribosomal small subunit protein bTHX
LERECERLQLAWRERNLLRDATMLFRLLIALAALSGVAAFTAPPTMMPSSAVSSLLTVSRLGEVTMGRGDKRTAKGKRKAKSFGMSRPRGGKLRKLKAERAESEE